MTVRSKVGGLRTQLRLRKHGRSVSRDVARIERFIRNAEAKRSGADAAPVLLFNASARIHHLSLNAAFNLISGWSVRLSQVPALQVVCRSGMLQCMLGTRIEDPCSPPPCEACISFSDAIFDEARALPHLPEDGMLDMRAKLEGVPLDELTEWEANEVPFGKLCIPTVRWALRRQDLQDDEATRCLFAHYLASASGIAQRFEALIEQHRPRGLVVFNGVTYPEAVARHIALSKSIPVATHEVGLRPFSAFFSHEHATAYPIELPADFELSADQSLRLDRYLEERFEGNFTMAGIKFWPSMDQLPERLLSRLAQFRQMVVLFTNVIFDTSQVHANVLFEDMYDWLGAVEETIRMNPDTYFVIRAHPDEDRPGKQSREPVSAWIEERNLSDQPNFTFLGPSEYASSYELMRSAKFVMVYNSSIGLEASILGRPVLCAGKARYTQLPTVHFPENRTEYFRTLDRFLADGEIEALPEHRRNARRFLYYQLYHASLDFSPFLEQDEVFGGAVRLKVGNPEDLLPTRSEVMAILAEGILNQGPFIHASVA